MLADVGTPKPQPRLGNHWQIELKPAWFGRWKATVVGKGGGSFELPLARFRARTKDDALFQAQMWCDRWARDDKAVTVDYPALPPPVPVPHPMDAAHPPQDFDG